MAEPIEMDNMDGFGKDGIDKVPTDQEELAPEWDDEQEKLYDLSRILEYNTNHPSYGKPYERPGMPGVSFETLVNKVNDFYDKLEKKLEEPIGKNLKILGLKITHYTMLKLEKEYSLLAVQILANV